MFIQFCTTHLSQTESGENLKSLFISLATDQQQQSVRQLTRAARRGTGQTRNNIYA